MKSSGIEGFRLLVNIAEGDSVGFSMMSDSLSDKTLGCCMEDSLGNC